MTRQPTESLHQIRRREIEQVFSRCPPASFTLGLELGAGDGFQSRLLAGYARRLVSSEYSRARLAQGQGGPAVYLVSDAEAVGTTFRPAAFDMVFSSNLMEHLPDPDRAFAGIFEVLADHGVCISIMPNPLAKVTRLLFFYPDRALRLLEVLSASSDPGWRKTQEAFDNNPKSARYCFLRRQLWPVPHGAYRSNWEEIRQYRRQRWTRLIEQQGFEVTAVLKMPFSSGYWFGVEWARRLAERIGLASGYAYVAFKRGSASPFRSFWAAG